MGADAEHRLNVRGTNAIEELRGSDMNVFGRGRAALPAVVNERGEDRVIQIGLDEGYRAALDVCAATIRKEIDTLKQISA